MNLVRGTFALIALLGVIALSSAPSACAQTSPPPCSNGPPRTGLSQKQPTEGSGVICTPRCEFAHLNAPSSWPLEAVPSGACDRDEYICEMLVSDRCATHGVQCECLDDEWECAIVSVGGGVCVDAAASAEASVPECSKGPPRAVLAPREEKLSNGACVPRCAFEASDASSRPSIEAVPSGACPFREYVCNMLVSDDCTTSEVQCECSNEWQCGIVRTGPSTCVDAGEGGD
jgi:hypothetical protein